ncbi:uncharacterized protein [Miscanthus floridulus]|uniref:uncharacterized protein n=1 Tax=Miscanthus floridulus TaxID=154761 RepID=UPI0034585B2A
MGSSVAGRWEAMLALANKFDMMSIGGSNSSAGEYMDRPGLPPRSLALGASASSSMSQRGCTKEHFFSEAGMETINKDNRLKDLVKTDRKRVKKILRNWEYAAQLKVQKANHIQDLQCQADALKM